MRVEFTTTDAAYLLRTYPSIIVAACNAGQIPGVHKVPGSRYRRIPRGGLLKYFKQQKRDDAIAELARDATVVVLATEDTFSPELLGEIRPHLPDIFTCHKAGQGAESPFGDLHLIQYLVKFEVFPLCPASLIDRHFVDQFEAGKRLAALKPTRILVVSRTREERSLLAMIEDSLRQWQAIQIEEEQKRQQRKSMNPGKRLGLSWSIEFFPLQVFNAQHSDLQLTLFIMEDAGALPQYGKSDKSEARIAEE